MMMIMMIGVFGRADRLGHMAPIYYVQQDKRSAVAAHSSGVWRMIACMNSNR